MKFVKQVLGLKPLTPHPIEQRIAQYEAEADAAIAEALATMDARNAHWNDIVFNRPHEIAKATGTTALAPQPQLDMEAVTFDGFEQWDEHIVESWEAVATDKGDVLKPRRETHRTHRREGSDKKMIVKRKG